MIKIKPMKVHNKNSIVHLFIIFIIVVTLLYLFMFFIIIVPKMDKTFEDLYNKADKVSASALAEVLEQYLYDRELALHDIAANTLFTKVTLLGDNKNPAFLDYIEHVTLLGEDPELTVIDAFGNIVYTELSYTELPYTELSSNTNIGKSADLHKQSKVNQPIMNQSNIQWAISLLSSKKNKILIKINNIKSPRFELAVPILYANGIEGILIASIDAKPHTIYKKKHNFGLDAAVAYEKNGQRIASDQRYIKVIHHEKINISTYDLSFTYTSNHELKQNKKNEILQSFIYSSSVGSVIVLLLLFLLGRKIIIQPLRELAATQRAIASAVEGISHIDTQGHYIKLNDAYAGMAGYKPTELEGELWSIIVYKDDLPEFEKAYQEMLKNGKVSLEARGVKKDGSLFYKHITMVSQHDDRNNFIGHHCFMKDITAKKIAEEKIHQQKQDLQLIFDHVPVKIWYKNDQNKILRLNKKAAESMGGNVEDFEGKNIYELFPDMAKEYHEDDLAVIQSQIPQLGIIEEHTFINTSRGWSSTDKVPYIDSITKQSFLLICSQDISSLKAVELAKDQLVEKLSHTNEELEKFVYIASHDLKAPLRGIEQLASWIQLDSADLLPEKSTKHLSLMVSRVERMRALLDDLLSYSRVNRMDFSHEKINLKKLLTELFDLHVEPFGFQFQLDVPEEDILIARKPFEIIIRNLLDNAVKHHHKGKGSIVITYKNKESDHLIEVSDDGPGIDPTLHELVFEMFKTLQPRDKVEGSGMGLAIVKKILLRYKGSISVKSDGKSGTTFKITWPQIID